MHTAQIVLSETTQNSNNGDDFHVDIENVNEAKSNPSEGSSNNHFQDQWKENNKHKRSKSMINISL